MSLLDWEPLESRVQDHLWSCCGLNTVQSGWIRTEQKLTLAGYISSWNPTSLDPGAVRNHLKSGTQARPNVDGQSHPGVTPTVQP